MNANAFPLDMWKRVAQDAELLTAASDCDPTDVASVSRLRKQYAANEVGIALELVQARKKTAIKFPEHADTLLADVPGIEQASSLRSAKHKAKRVAQAGLHHVLDVCCGIGGDAMGFSAEGLAVTAIDRDPVRAWMAQENAGCDSRVADAESLLETGATANTALHLDPARRTGAGRVFRLADYQPEPATIAALLARYPDAAVKLSPAVNLAELDEHLPGAAPSGEIEFISESGRLVQAVLWTGRLASNASRAATLLTPDQTHTLTGEPDEPGFSPAQRFLFTVDSAVERAGLMHLLELPAIHPRLGLLTANHAVDSPWLTGFELLAELPYSAKNPKKIKAWLDDHDSGLVEIKTRGKAVDPDPLQRALRGTGTTPYTLFILRFDQKLACLICRRLR
ncbi:MAG: class I SAM-dependent methyltransferase [Planctomycetota bacterium]